jgi:hypothetical protein
MEHGKKRKKERQSTCPLGKKAPLKIELESENIIFRSVSNAQQSLAGVMETEGVEVEVMVGVEVAVSDSDTVAVGEDEGVEVRDEVVVSVWDAEGLKAELWQSNGEDA